MNGVSGSGEGWEEALGSEEAHTLMDDLQAPRYEFELLRKEIQLLEERMDRKLADRLNEQTKTLFRTFMVSNAAMVLAVATLAFGAARLG